MALCFYFLYFFFVTIAQGREEHPFIAWLWWPVEIILIEPTGLLQMENHPSKPPHTPKLGEQTEMQPGLPVEEAYEHMFKRQASN